MLSCHTIEEAARKIVAFTLLSALGVAFLAGLYFAATGAVSDHSEPMWKGVLAFISLCAVLGTALCLVVGAVIAWIVGDISICRKH